MVFLRLGALLDDFSNQLAGFGLQPNFAALNAEGRRNTLKLVEPVAHCCLWVMF
jgi:hypothetical protein